jgi:osmotically-inducible protein OsmY
MTTMTNAELEVNVIDELYWDPKIDSAGVAVSADNGMITLRGTVGSLRQKHEAVKAAQRVYGVMKVNDQLDVRIMTEKRREDSDLRGATLQALTLDGLVPESVDVKVDNGFVTLTGSADWQYQRDEAEFVVANIPGVIGIQDNIALTGTASTADVAHSVKKAMVRHARLNADNLDIEAFDGTVRLIGTVRSWPEHDAAVAAAWGAPGVSTVDDRITVLY